MPLHPEFQAMIDANGARQLTTQTVADARAAYLRGVAELPRGQQMAEVKEMVVADVAVRLYRPHQANGSGMIYFHGGGWVLGSIDGHDGICRDLAAGSGATVVSVDYRLAPEHVFPAAYDDVIGVCNWMLSHGPEIDVDPARLCIAGDSAGGNLAAAGALGLRGRGMSLAAQLLIYPAVDARMTASSHDLVGPFLTGKEMEWFYGHYQGEADAGDWRLSPLMAIDHSDLPPALVITAEYDALRDEGEQYATALLEAGVDATCVRYLGMPHGFFKWGHRVGPARDAMIQACTWLRGVLRRADQKDGLYGVW